MGKIEEMRTELKGQREFVQGFGKDIADALAFNIRHVVPFIGSLTKTFIEIDRILDQDKDVVMEEISTGSKVLEESKLDLLEFENFLIEHARKKERDFNRVLKLLREIESDKPQPLVKVTEHLRKHMHLLDRHTLENWLAKMN